MAPDPILRPADDRSLRAALDRSTCEASERRIAAELRLAQQRSCRQAVFEEGLKRLARRCPP